MYLDSFYTDDDSVVRITEEHASRFAKEIAGDFNPIHDPGSRRFCVPGDLLFALVLARFGLFQRMSFTFHHMVGGGTPMVFGRRDDRVITVADVSGRVYLEAAVEGESTRDESAVEEFSRRYVSFSGLNFPHYLKPLLREKGVMFNPQRPLVIYDSMDFSLQSLDVAESELSFSGASLNGAGKRADVRLAFRISARGRTVGDGSKKLIISGLRPYDETVMENVVTEFGRLKDAYANRK